jgi:membrane-bound serine protease (ClpP class)
MQKLFLLLIAQLFLFTTFYAEDSVDEKFAKHIIFPKEGKVTIGHIAIDDRQSAISQSTWIYINAAVNAFKKEKPICVILELNTPGGEVFAAERISDALKELDTQYDIPVITYINNWAISAGALLAYSCRYIVIAKDASMGAAEPVIAGAEGKMEAASEKVNSALRSDFANRAAFFGRNPLIAEAMVDKDVILVMRHGEILKLDSEEQIRKGGLDPDTIISPKGKLLTLDAVQMMKYGVADSMLEPIKLLPLSEEELASGSWPITQSALVQIPFFARHPDIQISSFQMSWQLKFLAALASPVVSSLLFLGLIIAFYIEMSTGGFGVAGACGVIFLFLIVLSSFALEAIHWLEPILFFFGLFLLLLEIFFFPTLGILGFVGTIFLLAGLLGMLVPGIGAITFDGKALNAAGEYVLHRLGWLSGAFLVACAIIGLLSRFIWPKFTLMKRLVLTEEKRSKAAVEGTMPQSVLTELPSVGDVGVVIASLRPAGKVLIGKNDIDAVSSGNFLTEGTKVRVIAVEGARVVVEEYFAI